jgi:hypothetical protein
VKYTPAPVAEFELSGVPPSPNRVRLAREDPLVLQWKTSAIWAARSAANKAHWPRPPARTDPPTPRYVSFTLYRHQLLDPDHMYTSFTPIFNGLKGALIVDDSFIWAQLLGRQVQIPRTERERTVVRVSLVPSNVPEPAQGDAFAHDPRRRA